MLDNHECVQIKFLIYLGCALCHSGHFPAVTACFSSPACHLKDTPTSSCTIVVQPMLFYKVPKIFASMIEVVVEKSNQFSNTTNAAEVSSVFSIGGFTPQTQ